MDKTQSFDTTNTKTSFEYAGSAKQHTYVPGLGYLQEPRQYEQMRLKRMAALLGMSVLLYFIFDLLFQSSKEYFLRLFIPSLGASIDLQIIEQLYKIIMGSCILLVPFIIYIVTAKMSVSQAVPMRKTSLSVTAVLFFIGLGATVIANVIAYIVQKLCASFTVFTPVAPSYAVPTNGVAYLLMLINICVLPALLEEFVFRGVILQSLKNFGEGFALIASSIIFAVAHRNLLQGVGAFFVGLILAFINLRTHSLKCAILIHLFNNGFAVLLDAYTKNLSKQDANLVTLVFYFILLSAGILACCILMKKSKNFFILSNTQSLLATGEKLRITFLTPTFILACLLAVAMSTRYFI